MNSAVFGEAGGASNFGAGHRILHVHTDMRAASALLERLSEREQRYDCNGCRNSNLSSAAAQPLHVFATGERVPRCLTCNGERLRDGFSKRARWQNSKEI